MSENPTPEAVAAIVKGLSPESVGSFRRAFKEPGSHIVIDGWSPQWAREDTAEAHKLGLLSVEEDGDDQYTLLRYRPTDLFRQALTGEPK